VIGMLIEPMDTLFFRDGTPFSSGSASQDDVGGLFPPHPATVAGAVRAFLARCQGWNGRGRWPNELDAVLGDGPTSLGKLWLYGPFVVWNEQPLFPVPRHLMGLVEQGQWRPHVFLRPGPAQPCDLGQRVRLPEPSRGAVKAEELETGDGHWLTRDGLEAVLQGRLPDPDTVVSAATLWAEEPRVGIARDRLTRTAQEGMLYSTRHVRPARGLALGVGLTGVPNHWKIPDHALITLGGEGRMAACRPWDWGTCLDVPEPETCREGRVTLIALTPLDLGEATPTAAPSWEGASLVSACTDRPQRIGGWDSLKRRPLPLRSVWRPGSVLFCEIDDDDRFRASLESPTGLQQVGSQRPLGFGGVALGVWPDDEPEVN